MELDVGTVSGQIQECIVLLDKGRAKLDEAATSVAIRRAEYDRDLAICLMKMRNGKAVTLEGEVIENPPASTSEKIAKGVVWESRLALEEAEAQYKVIVSKIDVIRAKLNGYQSIYRRLDNIATR